MALPKPRNVADIRYYLYISATKLDMLYDQMYRATEPRRAAVTLATPIGSASVATESREQVSRESKLRAVEEELERRQLVGTLEEPKDYVRGIMPMRWGLYNDAGVRPDGDPALVYFGGFDKAEVLIPLMVGLGGSTCHVVGYEGASSTGSRSYAQRLVPWLLASAREGESPSFPGRWDMEDEKGSVFRAMAVALHYLKPPTQNMQFLARTLLTGTLEGHEMFTGVARTRVLLGSPIYVAQAHSLPSDDRWGLDEQWEPERVA